MTREQIDSLFEAERLGDVDVFINLIDDEAIKREAMEDVLLNSEFDNGTILNRICRNLLEQICNSGEYEYLEKKGLEDKSNNSLFVSMITTQRIPVDKAKKYIEQIEFFISKREIALATENIEFIEQCVNDNVVPEYKLIIEKNNPDEIKKYIEDKKIFLSSRDIEELIIATKDEEYIKKCIEDEAFYCDKSKLIKAIQDPGYIKQCLENDALGISKNKKVDLIVATHDTEYIKKCIEDKSLEFGEDSIALLIKATNDSEYIKKCIEDKSLEFDEETLISLIKSTKDIEYVKKCVTSLDLNNTCKIELIKATKYITPRENEDFDFGVYVRECIENESLELTDFDRTKLILLTGDENAIREQFACYDEEVKRIDLPEGMTIGIEIEAEGIELSQSIFDGWGAKPDGSLQNGLEIVSPILTPTIEDSQNIYKMCKILKNMNCTATERCGGHVHIGANYLTSKEAYINLMELWGNTEELMYIISNAPGDITRAKGVKEYAQPISREFEKALENGTINIQDEEELSAFIKGMEKFQTDTTDRYSGVNFKSIERHHTIEFRLANGTINPDTWIENINLFGGIINAAEQLAKIQKKDESNRTTEEIQMLEIFDVIKNKEISEKEKLDAFLSLTVGEDKKAIYEKRYEINSELLHSEHSELENEMKTRVAQKPIDIKKYGKKDVGRGIFTGRKAVTGYEMEEASNVLNGNVREVGDQQINIESNAVEK